ncbi:MAG: site-2 protease family protein, partial [Elusimicrobiota bacterium]|nr:site-2 protease family protein [Elusimicrobiota bacterium]
TARLMGRITLNPIPHIDPIGTILVPIVLMIMPTNFIIGWAKPVPVNPYNFYNYKECTLKVSSAGILTNFAFATFLALVVRFIHLAGMDGSAIGLSVAGLLAAGASINIVLGLFNLIPIPPLDGSRIVSVFLPQELSEQYDRVGQFGIIILFLFIGIFFPVLIGIGNIFYRFIFMGMPA